MDDAIARSLTFEQFIKYLRDMGYEVKIGIKHMRCDHLERNDSLAYAGWATITPRTPSGSVSCKTIHQCYPLATPLWAKWHKVGNPCSFGAGTIVVHAQPETKEGSGAAGAVSVVRLPDGQCAKGESSSRKTHYLLREDIRKLKKRDRMASLLVKNRIETYEQLHAYRDECREMISHLCRRRAE